MTSLVLRNIRKSFGEFTAIHDLNLEVASGEFVVLVGPSGCGKSTLIRLIAGLEEISGGDLLIDGERVNDRLPKARDVAMVFQNYALYPHLTVRENMAFSLRMGGASRDAIAGKVEEAAEILGLSDYLDRRPAALSGGQRQRVAMGRAIVRNPKIFLFDEPLSNLDAQLRVAMRAELKLLHQRLGTTMVHVTHDQLEAMTLADKVVVMRAGRIVQVEAPRDLYRNPNCLFSAKFIGAPQMNILQAEATGADGGVDIVLRNGRMVRSLRGPDFKRGPVLVGIRPEALEIGDSGVITASVAVVEPTGMLSELHLDTDAGRMIAIVPGDLDVMPDERLRLRVNDPSNVLVFNPETEARIA